ncbi:MAG: class I SAM-dependent methyltransferase [Burkholderiales bacterium]|nr:class I SAM-dependent methyltransferase [Burkholderiales bacterium]
MTAACATALALTTAAPVLADAKLEQALAGKHRDAKNVARDPYRHPRETLEFFGIKPDMTVVEIWPSAGWWTEILAPYLKDQGKYYAAWYATGSKNTPEPLKAREKMFDAMVASRPDVYGKLIKTSLLPPDFVEIAPKGSADMVLTFRSVHNWARRGSTDMMFKAFYDALKPGGILGVKDHRAKPGTPFQQQIDSGYMTEAYVIEAAELAGFRLVGSSEVNANPKDTKDHEAGVWTLPPTLILGDKDREKYLAIGESDRMTLKFVKP